MNWIDIVKVFGSSERQTYFSISLLTMLFVAIENGTISHLDNTYTVLAFYGLMAFLSARALEWVVNYAPSRDFVRAPIRFLKSLTITEKETIQLYIKKQTRSISLDVTEPTVAYLLNEKVLIHVSDIGRSSTENNYAVCIDHFAWDFLKGTSKNPPFLSVFDKITLS